MNIVHTDNRLITAECDSGKRQARPLVRESNPHQETRKCQKSGRKPQMGALFQD
jgi:hypothetical protein